MCEFHRGRSGFCVSGLLYHGLGINAPARNSWHLFQNVANMKPRGIYNLPGLHSLLIASKLQDWAMPFLTVFLASFAIYFVSLDFYFLVISDDMAYVFRNPYLQKISLENIAAIFSNLHFGDYLLVNLFSYSWDYTWWEFNAFGYHLTQVVLHSLNACLLFLILDLLKVPKKA